MLIKLNTPSVLLVPNGEFLLRPYIFSGPCQSEKVEVRIEGTIVAPINDNEIENSEYWIKFDQIDGLEIYGGTIDVQEQMTYGNARDLAVIALMDQGGKNIKIIGLTSVNSNQQHKMIHKCEGVEVSGVHILAPKSSLNTDGIHIMKSSNVHIIETSIKTGDDCISIGHCTRGLHIQNIECGPGHGISIGSLGYYEWRREEVQDITVDGAVIKGAQNGLRIKIVAKDNHGFIEGIFYNNITMVDVFNPIVIDQNYCPHNSCYSYERVPSGIEIRNIRFSNIKGSSASEYAMKFDCSQNSPCKDLHIYNACASHIRHSIKKKSAIQLQ
ncbi:Polygalacturonase, family GH28 [Zostera marina]|uniref:Polygalacturonase, family GH28 n=1 Tax=Zostera marina TaxID=29655 RepID=A0A0K9P4Q9_ZOSMR|nr:Polygalacturonase, family GH28 [Zostera marina]